jgi:ADP-heptose:LPS heptosyltransferase
MTSDPCRILVDHSGEKGIGDVICELNVYPALKAQHPHSQLISRGSRTLAWGNPFIDAFDESSPDDTFDRIVRFQTNTHSLKDSLAQDRSIFDHFLHANGFTSVAGPPRLYALPEEVANLGLEPDRPDDLIIAYSVDSKEPDRRWGEERFAELLRYLQETYGGTYLELGNGFTAGHVGIGYDLVGQTDLRQTMALLSSADVFVGNHGGLTHLAGGVGTPILTPWGASTPYWAYAYDTNSVVVETSPSCRHCGWTGNVLPECRATSVFVGRTPCTQDISVAQMREAADQLISRLLHDKARFREERAARRHAARAPQRLERFEQSDALNPYANLRLFIGGETGWGGQHRRDDFARLRQIVAFPDWHNPESAWDSLVTAYISAFEAESPWVLTLSAAPLTGPEVNSLLTDYLRLFECGASLPKIMIILGSLSEQERRYLIQHADAYVPLEGPYHLDGVDQAAYVTQLSEITTLSGQ